MIPPNYENKEEEIDIEKLRIEDDEVGEKVS